MKTIVIYHKSDFDGIFCREIAKHFLGEKAEYIGWDYGEPEPDVDMIADVIMLDISVDGLMKHPRLVWIDHHKSAIEKYGPKIGYQIDGVAACRLAWQWFSQDHTDFIVQCNGLPLKQEFIDRKVKEPLAVRLAGEYDIWDKRDPNAELFQHGLRSQELSENMWDLLLVNAEPEVDGKTDVGTVAVQALLENGRCLQYAKAHENESIIKSSGFDLDFEGLKFLACNAARYNSFLFTAGIKPGHDALLGFNFDGKKWRFSMYHAPGKEHLDLSEIAKIYGGGGHKGACGFVQRTLPFVLP
jgi:hypothetical protein